MGESGRSLAERAREHHQDATSLKEDCNIIKHWQEHHGNQDQHPAFHFKIIGSFQDALTRQVSEAVRIDLKGGGVLNSKSEYSRCKLPRLTIDRDTWNSQKQATSIIESVEDVALEKLTTELEDNLASTGTRAFLQDGKRKKQSAGGMKKRPKRLNLDPLIGWGEGVVGEEEKEIQDWLTKPEKSRNNQTI